MLVGKLKVGRGLAKLVSSGFPALVVFDNFELLQVNIPSGEVYDVLPPGTSFLWPGLLECFPFLSVSSLGVNNFKSLIGDCNFKMVVV